jgi:hypothetical protein
LTQSRWYQNKCLHRSGYRSGTLWQDSNFYQMKYLDDFTVTVKVSCHLGLGPATIGHDFGQPARFVRNKRPNRCGLVCQFLNLFLHRFFAVCTAVYTLGLHHNLQRGLYGLNNIFITTNRKFCIIQISRMKLHYFQTLLQQLSEWLVP